MAASVLKELAEQKAIPKGEQQLNGDNALTVAVGQTLNERKNITWLFS